VTISATALRPATTAALGGAAILFITLVAQYHIPLRTASASSCGCRRLRLRVLGRDRDRRGVPAAFAQRVTAEIYAMSDALLATQMALAREQKLTDLGGVVAAAAHELGTPLATIKLVSSELVEELKVDQPELLEDVEADPQRRPTAAATSCGRWAGWARTTSTCATRRSAQSCARRPNHMRGAGKDIHYDIAPGPGGDARQPVSSGGPRSSTACATSCRTRWTSPMRTSGST
jgi:two-component system, sensor histidine kinase RegB